VSGLCHSELLNINVTGTSKLATVFW